MLLLWVSLDLGTAAIMTWFHAPRILQNRGLVPDVVYWHSGLDSRFKVKWCLQQSISINPAMRQGHIHPYTTPLHILPFKRHQLESISTNEGSGIQSVWQFVLCICIVRNCYSALPSLLTECDRGSSSQRKTMHLASHIAKRILLLKYFETVSFIHARHICLHMCWIRLYKHLLHLQQKWNNTSPVTE